ncbi:MAG TPA: hypothetical protein VFA53_06015 [Xanthobacteraceae bacterium]|nr:hypothetical protein [Xanthobacteraceae bacterium]
MKTLLFATALGVVLGVQSATADDCVGPFGKCALEVGATCERDGKGGINITFYDRWGHVGRFEECVGRVYESLGRPNPYKTSAAKPAARH